MRLMIDIPEEMYDVIMRDTESEMYIIDVVKKGTPITKEYDISNLMYEMYMEGVNMTGEYQGCWVRFKDIERIMNKYIKRGDAE